MPRVFLDFLLPYLEAKSLSVESRGCLCLASQLALDLTKTFCILGRDYGLFTVSEGLDSLSLTLAGQELSPQSYLPTPTEAMFTEQTGGRLSSLFMEM